MSRRGPSGWISGFVTAAAGRDHRNNSTAPRTGGAAGNAQISAWTGLLLLVLFAAEGCTILDMHALLDWHVILGGVLIPPVLLKTASTSWRMLGYYVGRKSYRRAGPPPVILRILGPLVVVTSLAVLATGVVLVVAGPTVSRRPFAAVGGLGFDWLFLHKATFFVWFAVMAVHVLGRTIPAVQLVGRRVEGQREVPGGVIRGLTLLLVITAGVVSAELLVHSDGSWRR